MADRPGRLVLVATPIGNLDDLSPRAARALADADVVACEDTRRTGGLLRHLGVSRPLVSFHEHNEQARTAVLLDRVAAGETVALVTDAGMPGIADPGFVIVREAHERGLAVEVVPGPSAVLHALVASGLPTDRFAFEGFLPRKAGARHRRLAELADDPRTLVVYVAPHRAAADLAAMADAFGADRPAALARELTKLHEEVRRDTLGALAAAVAAEPTRGEVTVVVQGAPPPDVPDADALADLVAREMAAGRSRRDAVKAVTARTGVSRSDVYAAALRRDQEDTEHAEDDRGTP